MCAIKAKKKANIFTKFLSKSQSFFYRNIDIEYINSLSFAKSLSQWHLFSKYWRHWVARKITKSTAQNSTESRQQHISNAKSVACNIPDILHKECLWGSNRNCHFKCVEAKTLTKTQKETEAGRQEDSISWRHRLPYQMMTQLLVRGFDWSQFFGV